MAFLGVVHSRLQFAIKWIGQGAEKVVSSYSEVISNITAKRAHLVRYDAKSYHCIREFLPPPSHYR